MAREELNKLGYRDATTAKPEAAADRPKRPTDESQTRRAREGFLAGEPPPRT